MNEYKRNPNIACAVCQKRIYRRPAEIEKSRERLFCSQACYGLSTRKEHPCVICKAPILAGANKKTCSRSCANRHRAGIQYKTGRPKDKVVSYRSLKNRLSSERGKVCERCSYSVYEILEVHHRDRDRNNNVLGNLELICPNCHAGEHHLKKH